MKSPWGPEWWWGKSKSTLDQDQVEAPPPPRCRFQAAPGVGIIYPVCHLLLIAVLPGPWNSQPSLTWNGVSLSQDLFKLLLQWNLVSRWVKSSPSLQGCYVGSQRNQGSIEVSFGPENTILLIFGMHSREKFPLGLETDVLNQKIYGYWTLKRIGWLN